MNKRGFAAVWIVLMVVIILVAAGGFWYYVAHKFAPQATTNSVSSSNQPSGKFDQQIYAIPRGSIPTLTGSAENVSYIRIAIPIGIDSSGYDINNPQSVENGSDIVPVINGKWSAILSPVKENNFDLFGTSTVNLYGYADNQGTQPIGLLASTQIVVNPTQSNPSAAFDQSSLSQKFVLDGGPTITGTASGTDKVEIYIAGFNYSGSSGLPPPPSPTGYQSFGYVIPINGHWSLELPNSNINWSRGVYPIELRDANGVNVLASDTLTIF